MTMDKIKRRVRSLSVTLRRNSIGEITSIYIPPSKPPFNPDFVLVFPLKVTRKIFTLCCEANYEHRVDEFAHLRILPFMYTLGRVSHTWRTFINSDCPQLWSRIRVCISPFMKPSLKHHLARLLSRARDSPLDLTILAAEAPKSRTVYDPDHVMEVFLKLREDICVMLLRTSSHWRRLCVDPGALTPGAFASVKGKTPRLVELVVDCLLDGSYSIQRAEVDMIALVHAPALRAAEFRNVFAYQLPWSKLESLVYIGFGDGRISITEYFYLHGAISSAISLRYLEIAHIRVPSSLSDQPIRNSTISHVDIRDSDMWRVLQLPGVVRVGVMCADLDSLVQFVVSSQCAISNLHIGCSGPDSPAPYHQVLPRLDAFLSDVSEAFQTTDVFPFMEELRLRFSPAQAFWKPSLDAIKQMREMATRRCLSHLGIYIETRGKDDILTVPTFVDETPRDTIVQLYFHELRRLQRRETHVEFVVNGE
ncbi:hypothetical protein CPB85DRAFT_1430166 [Mucidula mucida]|nr:hypothetical protein CPB85DRAFT_1430166 [Mucidula mucida]